MADSELDPKASDTNAGVDRNARNCAITPVPRSGVDRNGESLILLLRILILLREVIGMARLLRPFSRRPGIPRAIARKRPR